MLFRSHFNATTKGPQKGNLKDSSQVHYITQHRGQGKERVSTPGHHPGSEGTVRQGLQTRSYCVRPSYPITRFFPIEGIIDRSIPSTDIKGFVIIFLTERPRGRR